MYNLKNISKTYIDGKNNSIHVLNDVTITLPEKGFVSILGKSGSGKSTMLNILGLLETPSKGSLLIDETVIDFANDKQKNSFRREYISFVFQDYNLLNDLSVLDNLMIASNISTSGVHELLEIVGIENAINTEVKYLSGGERQRLAIARALVRDSKILLLDEPTGNLDEENSRIIFRIIKKIAKTRLVLLVSHDVENAQRFADHIYEIKKGKLIKKEVVNFDERLELTIKQELDESVNETFNKIKRNKPFKKIMINSSSKKKYSIEQGEENLFAIFMGIVSKEKGNHITIDMIKERTKDETIELEKNTSAKKKGLKFGFILKYAFRLLLKQKMRLVARITLMILVLALVFVQTNVLLINPEEIVAKTLDESNQALIPIVTELKNENTLREHFFTKGKYVLNMHKTAIDSDQFIHSFKMFPEMQRTDIDQDFWSRFFINVLIENEQNKDFFYTLDIIGSHPTENGEILISDFMAYYIFGATDVIGETFYITGNENLFFDTHNVVTYKISGVIQTEFEAENKFYSFFNSEEFYNKNFDSLNLKYSIALITHQTYIEHANMQTIRLAGSDFTRTHLDTLAYAHANFSLKYARYESQELLFGRYPSQKTEVVVSAAFLERSSLDEGAVGQSFSYKDLKASPNWVKYQDMINLYDILNEITIVGVIDSEEASIFVHNDLFQELVNESLYHLPFYYVITDKTDIFFVVETIHQNNAFIMLEFLGPVYSFKTLLESSFYNVLIVLQVIFSAIAMLLVWSMTRLSINQKEKEIGIMKSMGIKNINIMSIFLLQNGIFSLTTIISSIVLSIFGLHWLNNVLVSDDVFGSSYTLIHINIVSFFILIGLLIVINVAATISPFIRINRLDVSLTIKNANS